MSYKCGTCGSDNPDIRLLVKYDRGLLMESSEDVRCWDESHAPVPRSPNPTTAFEFLQAARRQANVVATYGIISTPVPPTSKMGLEICEQIDRAYAAMADVFGLDAHKRPFDFSYLREKNLARCREVFFDEKDWDEVDWSNATAGEVGELCNKTKKRKRGFGKTKADPPPSVEDCAEELADIVIYADLCAARMGVDLSEAVRRKFNEVSKRTGATVFM